MQDILQCDRHRDTRKDKRVTRRSPKPDNSFKKIQVKSGIHCGHLNQLVQPLFAPSAAIEFLQTSVFQLMSPLGKDLNLSYSKRGVKVRLSSKEIDSRDENGYNRSVFSSDNGICVYEASIVGSKRSTSIESPRMNDKGL